RELFLSLEFNSLVRDYAAPEPSEARRDVSYHLLQSPAEVAELVERIRSVGRMALDTETTRPDPIRSDLVGLSIALRPGEAYYLPFGHVRRATETAEENARQAVHASGGGGSDEEPSLFSQPADEPPLSLPPILSDELQGLVGVLEDPGIAKVGQNLKYDLLVLRRAGIQLRGLDFDTMVASYLLDPGRREHSLDGLALQHLDHRTISYEELL